MDKPDKSMIEKIQKLLSLANSDNENEAKITTTRANELLIKYNLSLQQVTDHQNEYVVESAGATGLTLKPHQVLIAQILMNSFFVKVMISRKHVGFSSGRWAVSGPRTQYQKFFQLVGTRENCKIAGYIFAYLNDVYPRLWKEYYETHSDVEVKHRQSYYRGLTIGISKMLEETKWKVEKETGLVVLKDPKLEEFMKKTATGSYGADSSSKLDKDVMNDGIEHGKNIQLKKPLETTRVDSGKALTGKKP